MIPEAVAIAILAIAILTNNMLCWLIVSYIDKKPTGLQTLLDKLTIRLIISNVSSCYALSTVTYLSVFPITLHPWIAKGLFLCQSFGMCIMMSWFITVICVKYICIFHPIILEECGYTDSEIAKYISIALITGLSAGLGLEVGLIDEIEKFTMYQVLMSETIVDENIKKKGMTKISMILYVLSFISISFTNFRIEQKGLNQEEFINSKQNEKQNKWKWRLGALFVILSILAIFMVLHKIKLSDSVNKFVNSLFLMTIVFILPPLIYIFKSNESLRKHAFECIRPAICL